MKKNHSIHNRKNSLLTENTGSEIVHKLVVTKQNSSKEPQAPIQKQISVDSSKQQKQQLQMNHSGAKRVSDNKLKLSSKNISASMKQPDQQTLTLPSFTIGAGSNIQDIFESIQEKKLRLAEISKQKRRKIMIKGNSVGALEYEAFFAQTPKIQTHDAAVGNKESQQLKQAQRLYKTNSTLDCYERV